MNNRLEKIGAKIKTLREHSGFTQKKIADYVNVDQSFISMVEKGKRALTSDMLDKLAALFGVQVSVFGEVGTTAKPLILALRASEINEEDLEVISAINKIALNCNFMTQLLERDQPHG